MTEEDWFWILVTLAAFYGIFAYSTDSWPFEEDEVAAEVTPAIASPEPQTLPKRPEGQLLVTTLDSGTRWTIRAGLVKGSRTARLGWLEHDHSKNANTKARSTTELWLANCERDSYKILSRIEHDPKGNPISSIAFKEEDAETRYATPATNAALVLYRLCDEGFGK